MTLLCWSILPILLRPVFWPYAAPAIGRAGRFDVFVTQPYPETLTPGPSYVNQKSLPSSRNRRGQGAVLAGGSAITSL